LATVGKTTSYKDTAVTRGTTYYYKVSAVNYGGEGSLSPNEVSAATPQ
jgi:fibronectin type 3 domain-containing protein